MKKLFLLLLLTATCYAGSRCVITNASTEGKILAVGLYPKGLTGQAEMDFIQCPPGGTVIVETPDTPYMGRIVWEGTLAGGFSVNSSYNEIAWGSNHVLRVWEQGSNLDIHDTSFTGTGWETGGGGGSSPPVVFTADEVEIFNYGFYTVLGFGLFGLITYVLRQMSAQNHSP